jgi:hypothetical protein
MRAWNDVWRQKTAPSAHEPSVNRELAAEVPLTGLSSAVAITARSQPGSYLPNRRRETTFGS